MSTKPVFVSAATTARVLTWSDMIDALRAAYAAEHDERTSFRAVARGSGTWIRALVSVPPAGKYMGAKIFGRTQQRQVTYLVPLFDKESSELVAIIDARHLTALRTAATSAVAIDRLLRKDNVTVGIIGSGGEAQAHLKAVAAVRKLKRTCVYSPTPASRERFAATFQDSLGITCVASRDASDAVKDADLVILAARSKDETPTINGDWLKPGALVVSVGSTLPEQRELDVRSIEISDLIVCDMVHEVVNETGDFIAAKAQGVAFETKLASLNDLVLGKIDDRVRESRASMYKSVGAAIQDIAVAEIACQRAVQLGLAVELDIPLEIHRV